MKFILALSLEHEIRSYNSGMSVIKKKDLLVYTGLTYVIVCFINGCDSENNKDNLHIQLNDHRHDVDENEKEKYFETKKEEISCSKKEGGCKLTMQMVM